MARNDILIDAPPAAVYEALLDTSLYAQWVVGAREVKKTDGSWPKPGARFHHRVGVGPVTLADTTKLVEADPDRRVVLEVRARPLGRAHVRLDLRPRSRGRRTKVIMTEHTTTGIWSLMPNPVENTLIHVRNAASLRRLRRLVTRPAHDGTPRSGR